MPKVELFVTIKNNDKKKEYKTIGIIQDEIIKYREDNDTIVVFDKNNNKLIRENKEYSMNLLFDINNNTTGIIKIHEFNKEVIININTNKIEKEKDRLLLEYKIDDEIFEYIVEVNKL